MAKDEISKPIENEIATASKDLDIFGGWLNYYENPDPILSTEARGKGIKLYDEISRDAHAFSVLQTRYLAVVGKEWSVSPAETGVKTGRPARETQEQKIASFVESVLCGCNFDQMRLEILQGILYGYYGTEIIWKIQNNDIVIDKFIGKHPRRFCFTLERESRLLTPASMIEGETLPDRKFLIFQYGDSDNPYGKGLGQKLWWPTWFKKNGIKAWVIFMEKFGMPTAIGKYPTQAKEQRAKLLEALGAIQIETGIAIPDTMAIEFLEASRSGDGTYLSACEYFDRQISKAVLGQTLTTEIGKTGSYAASQTHNDVRQDIIEADADLLDAYLNKVLIPWIVDFNFFGVIAYPKLVTNAGQKPDLVARSVIDKTLSVDVGLPIAKSYFYETYGVPEPQEGEEIVSSPTQVLQSPDLGQTGQLQGPGFAEGQTKYSPEQQAIEGLGDVAIAKGKPAISQLLAHIEKFAGEVNSLEELKSKLFQEYSHMDEKDLEEILFQSMLVANLHGRAAIVADTAKATTKT